MAAYWLEAARYADTDGYQNDRYRYQHVWRDWVILAFNENKPFDEFVVEQLAGDMLPGATLKQQIATGFCRNHRINSEDGSIPAEWHVENVVDRVDTFGTVFLGLTVGCARCHDHKYDPVSQTGLLSAVRLLQQRAGMGRRAEQRQQPALSFRCRQAGRTSRPRRTSSSCRSR